MKFDTPRCPTCRKLAEGTIDAVPGIAHLRFKRDKTAEYTGATTMWWDDQYTPADADGRVSLYCENGHRWQSKVEAS